MLPQRHASLHVEVLQIEQRCREVAARVEELKRLPAVQHALQRPAIRAAQQVGQAGCVQLHLGGPAVQQAGVLACVSRHGATPHHAPSTRE